MDRGKVIRTDGIRLPDGQNMNDIDETGYTYLAVLDIDKIKKKEIQEKFSNEYLRWLRLILRSKLNRRNKIMAVNAWAVSVMRYGAEILKWDTDELKSLHRRTRKFTTMNGALHPKSDTHSVSVNRELEKRGLISCTGCIRMEENNLGWYVRNSVDPSIEGVKAAETIEYNDTVNKKEFKQSWMREMKELWKNKKMYGQFVREMPETTDEKETWNWLRKAGLKLETEAMLCAAQEQAIRTNYVKHKIDKQAKPPLCRMCDKKSETISHIVSECEKLAQKEYKRRHDNVARIVRWKLCGKYNLKRSEKWYEHAPEGVVENEEVKILWDVMIHCDREIKAWKPDINVVKENDRRCAIIDIAIPGDIRVGKKEKEKFQRYQELKREIKRMWKSIGRYRFLKT